jgi:membrane-associated phospholipid phosphatase
MAIALVMGLSSLRWRPRLGVVVTVVAALLGRGAVYGGFHYAVDIGVGAAVGVLAWLVGRRIGRSDGRFETTKAGLA